MMCAVIITLMLGPFNTSVRGEGGSSKDSASDDWKFVLAPYGWLSSLDGDATVRGVKVSVDSSGSDSLDDIDFVAQIYLEAMKDKWGILIDSTYLKTSTDADAGPIGAELENELALVDIAALYRFGRTPLGGSGGPTLAFEMLGGGRYLYLKNEIELEGRIARFNFQRDFQASKDLIDPVVGIQLRANLTKRLSFLVRGDIGGFGVGTDFSWNASAIFGYQVLRHMNLAIGYRVLDIDYDTGSGSNKFEFDTTLSGPMIGLVFRF
jgi:hypothetical protein